MKKISSDYTLFHKKIFPALWLGFVIIGFLGAFISVILDPESSYDDIVMVILFPLLMLPLGLLIFYNLVFCLLDEVFYDDESLLIVNRRKSTHISFDEVQKVRYLRNRPPKIELTLYCEDKDLGKTLYFTPPRNKDLFTFKRHPNVEEFFEKFNSYKLSS